MLDATVLLCYFYHMTMQVRAIPDELHRKFKMLCAEQAIHMNKKVVELMRQAVEKREKKK